MPFPFASAPTAAVAAAAASHCVDEELYWGCQAAAAAAQHVTYFEVCNGPYVLLIGTIKAPAAAKLSFGPLTAFLFAYIIY